MEDPTLSEELFEFKRNIQQLFKGVADEYGVLLGNIAVELTVFIPTRDSWVNEMLELMSTGPRGPFEIFNGLRYIVVINKLMSKLKTRCNFPYLTLFINVLHTLYISKQKSIRCNGMLFSLVLSYVNGGRGEALTQIIKNFCAQNIAFEERQGQSYTEPKFTTGVVYPLMIEMHDYKVVYRDKYAPYTSLLDSLCVVYSDSLFSEATQYQKRQREKTDRVRQKKEQADAQAAIELNQRNYHILSTHISTLIQTTFKGMFNTTRTRLLAPSKSTFVCFAAIQSMNDDLSGGQLVTDETTLSTIKQYFPFLAISSISFITNNNNNWSFYSIGCTGKIPAELTTLHGFSEEYRAHLTLYDPNYVPYDRTTIGEALSSMGIHRMTIGGKTRKRKKTRKVKKMRNKTRR